jgi:hypothetical protein
MGSDQIPGTEGNRRPRYTGVAEAAGLWRMGTTVYHLISFCRKEVAVSSVTEQRAFILGCGIQPRRLGDGG